MSNLNSDNSCSLDLSQTSLRILEIFEEYTQRQHNGEEPSISEFERSDPAIAARIREVLTSTDAMAKTYESEPAMPKQIAGCQMLREVGRGAAGTVYEALHPRVSRRLAIKVLNTTEDRHNERFAREAEVLSQLVHPNIVPFMDCGSEGNITYLKMHYIDGASLAQLLRLHWDPEDESCLTIPDELRSFAESDIASNFREIARIGADIASALSCAHSHGVVHRDIKPGNLLLDRTGNIWVSDFGLAKASVDANGNDLTEHIVGTPRYMAPEQVRGVAEHEADIYSLGITLFELATGKRAWDSPSEQRRSQCIDLPDITAVAPNIPRALARIIMKACATNPEDRYPTAAELANVLSRFAETGKKGDRRTRPRYEGQRYVRKQPVIAALAILAVTGLSAFGFTRPPEAPDSFDFAEIGTPDFEEEFNKSVPTDSEKPSPEGREFRERIANSGLHVLILSMMEMSAIDKRQTLEIWEKQVEQFVDGKVSRPTPTTRYHVQSFLGVRIRVLREAVEKLNRPDTDQTLAALQQIRQRCLDGEVSPRLASRLDAVVPELSETDFANCPRNVLQIASRVITVANPTRAEKVASAL